MLCDVVRRPRRRWAHAPVIHAASHFDHKKRVSWVPISMHTCGSFFYNYGAPLGGPSGRRSSAIIREVKFDVFGKLLPSVFSSLYSRIKIFVFAVNSKRHFSIFV